MEEEQGGEELQENLQTQREKQEEMEAKMNEIHSGSPVKELGLSLFQDKKIKVSPTEMMTWLKVTDLIIEAEKKGQRRSGRKSKNSPVTPATSSGQD